MERPEELQEQAEASGIYQAAVCSARGLRDSQEDEHVLSASWHPELRAGLFAVLDGHGGAAVAILASRMLGKLLREELAACPGGADGWRTSESRGEAVERAFARLDGLLARKEAAQESGSTCVAAMVWPDAPEPASEEPDDLAGGGAGGGVARCVLLANLGDSRGLVLRRSPSEVRLLGETSDHKPDAPEERRRIIEAGGFVTAGGGAGGHAAGVDCDARLRELVRQRQEATDRGDDGGRRAHAEFCGQLAEICREAQLTDARGPARVDGDLALSRAFGDFRLKGVAGLPPEKQKVSMVPDVYEFQCRAGDVLLLACDGVFDVMGSREVADAVCRILAEQDSLAAAARGVVQEALSRGSTDNVTCLVVQI